MNLRQQLDRQFNTAQRRLVAGSNGGARYGSVSELEHDVRAAFGTAR